MRHIRTHLAPHDFIPRSVCSIEGWGAALVAGAVVAGVAGSALSANAQKDASSTAANTQQGMFNTITGQEQPFLNAGYGATQSLSELLGTSPTTGAGGTAAGTGLPGGYLTQTFNPTMQDLQNYPGYQFALQQGAQAVTNSQTPGVGALSGPALKSLTSFNQGLASTQYQNAFNNFQTQQTNIFNRLNSIAGLGQNAAGNLGNAGTSLGTGIAQAQAAGGAATAGGIVGATNNIGSGLTLAALTQQGQGIPADASINDPGFVGNESGGGNVNLFGGGS